MNSNLVIIFLSYRKSPLMRSLLLFLFLLLSQIANTQDPTLGLTQHTQAASSGYTFFCPSISDCFLLDECGLLVNSWQRESAPGLSARLLDNGLMLRTKKYSVGSFFQASTGGEIELVDFDNNTVGSYIISDQEVIQHHDALMMPNGNLLLLGWEKFTSTELALYGATTSQLWSEIIYEIELINETEYEIVWEWNLKDHLIQDLNPNLDNYAIIKDNIGKVDINYRGPTSWGDPDRWHCNAIDYNLELDQILFNSRNNSEVWIIDHSTTSAEAASSSGGNSNRGGELLYRWGNPQAYDQGESSDLKMYGSHGTYWIPEGLPNAGKIMFFNNGDQRPEGYYSTIEMIDPSETDSFAYAKNESEHYLPLESELVYIAENPFEFKSTFLSNAQQLANGNIFINEGGNSRFFEVDSTTNTIIWEYISPVSWNGIFPQGVNPSPSSTFRAYKYEPDFIGFSGLDLTPGDPLELNPGPSICNLNSTLFIQTQDLNCLESEFGSCNVIIYGENPSYSVTIINEFGEVILEQDLIANQEFTVEELLPGLYYLTTVDELGDLVEETFEILRPESVEVSVEIEDLGELYYCNDELPNNVSFSIDGGTPPYNYVLLNLNGQQITSGIFSEVSLFKELSLLYTDQFILEVIDQNGCVGAFEFSIDFNLEIDLLKVEVEVTPATGPDATDGEIVAHISGGVPPYQYFWIGGKGVVIQDSIYSNLGTRTYVLNYQDANGCTKNEFIEIAVLSSIEETDNHLLFKLYPSLASEFINIELGETQSNSNNELKILDKQGHVINALKLDHKTSQIDISHLPNGVYFVKVHSKNKTSIKKFVKL